MADAQLPPLGYGVATSSYQIEGALDVDGRGRSIWDELCARTGAIADGSDGAIACESYARFDEDLALLEDLGVSAYRFSIAWPRVQPGVDGRVETRGLDYYDRVVDGLLGAGIRPFPTLYHWDLPQALEEAGGWPVRDTALRFAEYAAVVAERLGDRVTHWATMNEPWCSAFLGYAAGVHAPGRREGEAAYAAAHHLLLGHALGAAVIRDAWPAAQVGIVLNMAPVRPEPDADPLAVDMVDAVQNRLWLDALADGSYPTLLTGCSPALTEDGVVREGDLAAVVGSADWVGVNYYTPFRVGPVMTGEVAVGQDAAAYPYTPAFSFHPRPPRTDMGWEVDASGLEAILLTVAGRLPGVPLRVTENGAAFPDREVQADGSVSDPERIGYLRDHLAAVERARAAGAPVHDYLAWSLLDNFEWAEGYTKTFGLATLDPRTRARTPKQSFHWYAERARAARES
jgi:beta-glucosidase